MKEVERVKPKAVYASYAEEVDVHANTKIQTIQQNEMTYRVTGVDGEGTVDVFQLFPGVILQFHNFHCKSFQLGNAPENHVSEGLKINYCLEGRMEVRMSDGLCLFMTPGKISLDVRTIQDRFQFPSGHYRGVELFLHYSLLEQDMPDVWKFFSIDIRELQSRFCREDKSYVIGVDERLKSLFESLLDAPYEQKADYFKIKITELLFLLQSMKTPGRNDTSSLMTIGQVEIAKQVMEVMTKELHQHFSIEELARPFGISASSVQNYFQGVYGKNISTFLKETRMSTAADMLTNSVLPIAEIALTVGYENASKFASAFKKFYGISPSEYRRQCRCGIKSIDIHQIT